MERNTRQIIRMAIVLFAIAILAVLQAVLISNLQQGMIGQFVKEALDFKERNT